MTSIQFYSDDNCLDLGGLGNSTGTPDGLCTQFAESVWKSFRVVTLERTCAVTIYGSDIAFCSSSKLSVASFGACVTNTTVNQFSVDCADYQIATSDAPASYVSAAPSRTASPVAPSSSAAAATTGLSTGAKVGIGAGIAAVILLLIALGMWLIIRRRRKARQNQEPAPPMGELSGNAGFPVEAPPGYSEETKLGHDRKAPRVANQEPVEAMGDVHWRGGVHEMESPSVTTGTMSSEGWRSQRG